MAECDERLWLAALSLVNSGMEADDASNKTFVAVMCPINGYSDKWIWRSTGDTGRVTRRTPSPAVPGAHIHQECSRYQAIQVACRVPFGVAIHPTHDLQPSLMWLGGY
jgi:hypothetical protein